MVTDKNNTNHKTTKSKSAKNKKSQSFKLNSLNKKLAYLEEENSAFKDKMLRKAAEFENYKKRTENEFSQLTNNATGDLIAELLPVCDDLERSVKSAQKTEENQSIVEGIELIHKNLMKVLENKGVKAIEAVGKEFDPEQHEALMQVESKDHQPGFVVEEHLRGYSMNGRVLRHSQVLVSK